MSLANIVISPIFTIGAAALPLLIVIMIRLRAQNTTHGSAAWLSFWNAYRAGFFAKKGLIVGDWIGLLPVKLNPVHALTFGPTGSGKGAGTIIPNLLDQLHIFLVDPGGENTAVAIREWRSKGMKVFAINPFGMHGQAPYLLPRHGFNPLMAIKLEARSMAADAKLLADMLIARQGQEAGAAAFFLNAAVSLLRAMIIHIISTEPEDRRHLGTLYDYLHLDAAGWDKLLRAMKLNISCGGLVRDEANTLERREHQAPEEFSAIMSTAQEQLSWLADPVMRETLARHDVSFESLKGHMGYGAAIAVILPLENIETHAAITRLALGCAILTMQRAPVASSQPLFVLDEAAALGRIKALPNWLATMRRYKARFWPIFQDAGQLRGLYREDAAAILANCEMLQVLGVNDLTTANLVRDLIGITTVEVASRNAAGQESIGLAHRHLVTADEVLRFPEKGQIIFYQNHAPMALFKTAYFRRPDYAGRVNDNPFRHAPTRFAKRRLATLIGKVVWVFGTLFSPHPLVGVTYFAGLTAAITHALNAGGLL